jgi:hypothetical protein
MPARTERQRKYMCLCANNPERVRKKKKECPPREVAREFCKKEKK